MRYTAEFRGGDYNDDPNEWCIIDEHLGWCGSMIVKKITEQEAKTLAAAMNKKEQ